MQDAITHRMPLSIQFDEVSPVVHETTRCDENADPRVNCGQAMPGRQRDNLIAMDYGRGVGGRNMPAIRFAGKCLDGTLNVGRVLDW